MYDASTEKHSISLVIHVNATCVIQMHLILNNAVIILQFVEKSCFSCCAKQLLQLLNINHLYLHSANAVNVIQNSTWTIIRF